MALDLAVPPLAMLVMTAGAFVCVTAVAGYAGAGWGGFGLAAGVLAIVVAAVLAAWARYGRGIVSGWQLAFAPVYAVKKVPLYLSFLTRRQTDWVRTRRDS
jgi:hypothetical protein